MLRWFAASADALDDHARAVLVELPIFPTAHGCRPLRHLVLPGDFTDELKLADIVATAEIRDLIPFLESLGADHLSFATYCQRFVAPKVADGVADEEMLSQVVSLLARRLNEVRGDAEIREALSALDLVPCTDGSRHPGERVYLRRPRPLLLRGEPLLARIPPDDHEAHEDLFGWLGAASRVRPVDIVARARELIPSHDRHTEIAAAIIEHVASRFAEDETSTAADFAALREFGWLPAIGVRSKGFRPHQVHLRLRQNIYASQAKFLDVPLPIQQQNVAFFDWLGTPREPSPEQVVAHLLWCAKEHKRVTQDFWIYLESKADDPALDKLRDQKCLYFEEYDAFASPAEVFVSAHPFGRWRFQLGPTFLQFGSLLERLEVRDGAGPDDAIDVLGEVAARHSGEEAPLIEEDAQVVNACWNLLSDALHSESVRAAAIGALSRSEVVLDEDGLLRRPTDVFFRDSVALAGHFGPEVAARLIPRPEGAWAAMAAAGVQELSEAVEPRIVERTAMDGGGPGRADRRAAGPPPAGPEQLGRRCR